MAGFLLVATSVLFGHSTFAYTNLPYTVYFVMGTIYIYLWMVEPKKGYLILSALMIGLSTWTRSSEPFWLANLVILVLYSLAKRKILAPIFYSLVFFSIQQPWRIYLENKITYSSIPAQIQTSLSVFTFGIDLGRITNVAAFIYDSIVVSWQPLLFLFLLVVFLELKNHFRNQSLLFLGLILANFLLLVSGVYIFAFSHPDWQDIPGSATRMSMFFIPLFIFYIFSSKKVEEIFNGK